MNFWTFVDRHFAEIGNGLLSVVMIGLLVAMVWLQNRDE